MIQVLLTAYYAIYIHPDEWKILCMQKIDTISIFEEISYFNCNGLLKGISRLHGYTSGIESKYALERRKLKKYKKDVCILNGTRGYKICAMKLYL